jgi:hypothetical protein
MHVLEDERRFAPFGKTFVVFIILGIDSLAVTLPLEITCRLQPPSLLPFLLRVQLHLLRRALRA